MSSLLGFYFPDWREFTVVYAVLIALASLCYLFVPKSMRFLYATGDYEEARKCLKNLAQKTGSEIDDAYIDTFETQLRKQRKSENKEERTLSTIDLFRNGRRKIEILFEKLCNNRPVFYWNVLSSSKQVSHRYSDTIDFVFHLLFGLLWYDAEFSEVTW